MARAIEDIMATRDAKGRFGPKPGDTETPVEAESQPVADATPEPEPEPQATPEPPTEASTAPEPQPPTDPDSDPKNWTYAAYRDEKQKRQDALRRLQAAENRTQQLEAHFQQQQQQRQHQPPPDQFLDPDGYNAYWENRFLQQENAFQERLRNQEANVSFRIAHDKHGEAFEQAYETMIGLAEAGDRTIVQAVANSPDPGAAMVRWYKTYQVQQEVGDDLPGYIERKVAERLAEAQPQSAAPKPNGPMPSNLAGSRSVSARTGPEWSGPAPIADIFERRAKSLGKR